MPKAGGNKGTATQVLHDHQLAGAGIAIYLGDDLTDEDAFRALANAVTIHVGHRETAARFRVESSNRVAEFFDWLIQTARREQ